MRLRGLTPVLAGLALSCGGPVAPTLDETVDTLEFVVGDPAAWPRRGSQWQHQAVDFAMRKVCWVKYGNPRMFECWRWDDEWIYHVVDHGLDGETGESYEFSDGRWLPRQLSGLWSLDVAHNQMRWFDPLCRVDQAKSRPAPYALRAWTRKRQFISADLGARDVLVLEYRPDPDNGTGYRERFHFARGAGWFAWENLDNLVRFDRFGGPARNRTTHCSE